LSDVRVAWTFSAPVPYPDGRARKWIEKLPRHLEEGRGLAYAITLTGSGEFMGTIGCEFNLHHARAMLWYWLNVPYWKQGYCTEACRVLLDYLFGEFGLHRVEAFHHLNNHASGRVMEKLGMQRESVLRKHSRAGDEFVDSVLYAVLQEEWLAKKSWHPGVNVPA
jgi:[ribosomal protein S5]-alanine N-acetyltransferase